ncbi:flagella basal body P-ring formation protein FlgA [Novosphingobium sp. PhB165]|uniref:flagellar basal body P-ring formation chaperone FlgA n=1 Tax=Novosphingobium sp. PhB165 TaxID=2485105 RepID=UPI0010463842|nr:flagellar basal body P-ring formation chaperone FlgA [Novosphingobium sp. PhB165]TCM17692.1 flagella basal body P-ring formation protein FlgA [Novosphingobium sp. PhB165]
MAAAILFMLAAAAPVAAPAVPEMVKAPVLVRTVERGETLGAGDFTQSPLAPGSARGALSPAQAAGQEATRRLNQGAPVRAGDVAAPRLIHRGEAVTISVSTATMHISSAGRALADAGKGEPVRVLNLATNRTLDAVADGPGQVSIPMR